MRDMQMYLAIFHMISYISQKLFDIKMASFRVNLLSVWSKDGSFERLASSDCTL